MSEYKFGVSGERRKQLAGAISEILNQPLNYQGAPSFAYEAGGYRIDRDGTVTGEFNLTLFAALEQRGFEPEVALEQEAAPNRLTIEMPLDGFTPETVDNLYKMVAAKENLLMAALGADALPVHVLDDRIAFPWFAHTEDAGRVTAYSQLIAALCATAKEKKRVTAKAQDAFENEKFSMRVWLIGLGCIGAEYKTLRKIMGENLGGNSSWRYGKPEKAAPAPENAETETPEEVPAGETAPAQAEETEASGDE